jgi:L-alanine-DL-glutamate epimerase-like enolase superfamily enzyme
MCVAELRVYQVDLPLAETYTMSEGSYTVLDSTVVEIVSATGVSGWGEVYPVGPTTGCCGQSRPGFATDSDSR